MSKFGNITDFFRPSRNSQTENAKRDNDPKRPETAEKDNVNPLSSPLSDPPSSLLSKSSPSQSSGSGPEAQLKRSLIRAIPQPANVDDTSQQEVSRSASAAPLSFLDGSFDSSQRIVKNGREIVTNSDGEDTDSIASLESPEDFFKKLTATTEPKEDVEIMDTDGTRNLRSTRGQSKKNTVDKFFAQKISTPKYKHTLESLVTDSVDDDETEAGVAKIRSAFDSSKRAGQDDQLPANDGDGNMGIHEDVLASAVGEGDDQPGLQRLLDAVRRTEAFDQEKVWSFFRKNAPAPSPPNFPRDSIRPGTKYAALRGRYRFNFCVLHDSDAL